jgi:hypothetical protein
MYCSAGRTYNRYKVVSDGNNCNKLMYLLTGLSNENSISPIGTFFATTSFIPIMDYTTPYHTNYEKTYMISHSDNEFKKITNKDVAKKLEVNAVFEKLMKDVGVDDKRNALAY